MKVPANIPGDKLILDYLARVTEAGLRYLPKGARMAFVGRTRALIERECGPDGRGDPARVTQVLTGLGDPEELVRQERARIDADWARRRAGRRRPAGDTPAVTRPRDARPITSRWRPAMDTQPVPRPPLPWWAGGEQVGEAVDAGMGEEEKEPVYVEAPAISRHVLLARTAAQLARRHPVEAAAVITLGIGGVIFPFPFWPLGGLLALPSRLFDGRDKWIALTGPILVVVVGSVLVVPLAHVPGNAAVAYFHAFAISIGYLVRVGSLVCAVYLARRVQRGPRVRVPPWKR